MSDGISWYYETLAAKEEYAKYIKSGKVKKEYLESDIRRLCSKKEISLLVTRLIIHELGGIENYLKDGIIFLNDIYNHMSEKDKLAFIQQKCLDNGFELNSTVKVNKLRNKIKEMDQLMSQYNFEK